MSFYKVVFSQYPYGFLDDFEKIETQLATHQLLQ